MLGSKCVELELVGMLGSKCVELLSEQNIFLGLVCVQQVDPRGVILVLQDCFDDLVGRCDSSTSCDETNISQVHFLVMNGKLPSAKVGHVPNGPLHLYLISNLQALKVLGEYPAIRKLGVDVLEVHFDDKIKVSNIIIGGRWSIGSHDQLSVHLCCYKHVVPHGK